MDEIPEVVNYQDYVRLNRRYSKAKFDNVQKDEQIEYLKAENKKLRDQVASLQSKVDSLEYVKTLSVDLQSRLGFASAQVDKRREEEERKGYLLNQKAKALEKIQEESTLQKECLRELETRLNETTQQLQVTQKELHVAQTGGEKESVRGRQLESALEMQQSVVHQLSADRTTLQTKCRELGEELRASQLSLETCRDELARTEKENCLLIEKSRLIDQLKVEVQTVRTDNSRLVKLIASTKEYREFQRFWEDSDGVSFIPHKSQGASNYKLSLTMEPSFLEPGIDGEAPSASLVQNAPGWGNVDTWKSQYSHQDNLPVDSTLETSHWVPKEAMQIGNKFAFDVQYDKGTATKEMIDSFLWELNRIWGRREARRVQRLRNSYNEKMDEVKRKANMSKSFDSIAAKQQIMRLEKQLLEAKRAMKVRRKGKKSNFDGPTASSLLMAESNLLRYYSEKGEKSKANSPVRTRKSAEHVFKDHLLSKSISTVKVLEDKLHLSMEEGKAALIKGAVWFGRNAVVLLEELERDISLQKDKSILDFQMSATRSPKPLASMEIQSRCLIDVEETVANTRYQITEMIKDLDHTRKTRDMRAFNRVKASMPIQNPDISF